MNRPHAILLLGPTGSGKTPLGELLASRGLGSARCVHFDFGEKLRRVAAGLVTIDDLTEADRMFVTDVLDSGALLEDQHFHIAEIILRAFLAENDIGPGDWIILNGLPRHVGQADDVDRVVAVRAVVELSCTPATVLARLSADTGGDRAGRIDDDHARVEHKLELYAARTRPLLDHYRRRGAEIITVNVEADTAAEDIHRDLPGRDLGHNPSRPR